MSNRLFAYGTLRHGSAPAQIAGAVGRLRPLGGGVARGQVYDLGEYPGAVFSVDGANGAAEIKGEVYEVPDDATWREMDAYEGSEFARREVEVRMGAAAVVCWAYEYIAGREFGKQWRAEVLGNAPLIAPAGQFVYPRQVAGEEDTLARGALLVMVHPAGGGSFLATCALGFKDAAMPTGIWACPNPREMCAVAGGYAYVIDTGAPERSIQVPLKPVVEVLPLEARGLLVFVGFHTMVAWGAEGLAWQSGRLSWEGIRITDVEGEALRGFGWNMRTDREVEFAVDLRNGEHTGGGF